MLDTYANNSFQTSMTFCPKQVFRFVFVSFICGHIFHDTVFSHWFKRLVLIDKVIGSVLD